MRNGVLEDTQFLLIRHGETEWNRQGLWQGHQDSPLTARGLAQAEQLAAELADSAIDRFACSDLGRCRQTAAPLASALGMEPELRPELRELDVGSWSGLGREQIARFDAEQLRRFDAREDVRPGGGEKRSELAERVHGFVEQLALESPGACIVLVTHSGVVRALTAEPKAAHARAERRTLAAIRSVRGAPLTRLERV
jgi:probable phosphoglycerate mutase